MLLAASEWGQISVDGVEFSLKPSTFVKRPHFTTKKKIIDKSFPELDDHVKSPTFHNFADAILESSDFAKVESTIPERQFGRQPKLSLTKSMRIDLELFLADRIIETGPDAISIDVKEKRYLLPPCATFIQCDMQNLATFNLAQLDLIYMDPPWQNKSVRRGAKYAVHSNDDIFDWIQVEQLLSEDGLIAVWITNKQSVEYFVRAYFETRSLLYAGEWEWVKLAASGETVYPLGSSHKRPTERLLFFSKSRKIRGQTIYSVASAIHSRKPFIYAHLEQLLSTSSNAKMIELFARRLRSNWLSIGNEPMYLHDAAFFHTAKNDE